MRHICTLPSSWSTRNHSFFFGAITRRQEHFVDDIYHGLNEEIVTISRAFHYHCAGLRNGHAADRLIERKGSRIRAAISITLSLHQGFDLALVVVADGELAENQRCGRTWGVVVDLSSHSLAEPALPLLTLAQTPL